MKTIGLLGGMSWESTIPYYRLRKCCYIASIFMK